MIAIVADCLQAMDYCLSGKEKEAIIKLTAAIQADPSDPAHHLFR